MKFAAAMVVVWFSGLFGLLQKDDLATTSTGGFVGDTINSGMLALVDAGVAIFLYVLLIALPVRATYCPYDTIRPTFVAI